LYNNNIYSKKLTGCPPRVWVRVYPGYKNPDPHENPYPCHRYGFS
jgi:hypothetical protein